MQFRVPTENMKRLLLNGVASLLPCGAVLADDVSGSDSLLCYGLTAARCETGEGCQTVEPWKLDLPDFVKLDLRGKIMRTTATSPQSRETPLQFVERDGGRILIHGSQGERAFTWLIAEATGEGTLSVAGHGQGVTVFTVCTAADKL
jgi:hypothetical protein